MACVTGKPIGVGISGGSITIGTGTKTFNEDGFFGRIVSWINATYPHADHKFVNGGMGGSTSGYMAQCIERYLPGLAEMDIIFLEFDLQDPFVSMAPLDNPIRSVLFCACRDLMTVQSKSEKAVEACNLELLM